MNYKTAKTRKHVKCRRIMLQNVTFNWATLKHQCEKRAKEPQQQQQQQHVAEGHNSNGNGNGNSNGNSNSNNDKRLTSGAADLDTSANRHIKRPRGGRRVRDWQTNGRTNGLDVVVCRYVLQLANCTFMLTWRWATPLGRHRPPPRWPTDNINQS